MPELNTLEPDPRDLDGTQPGKPIKVPAPIPQDRIALPPRPPKMQGHGRQPQHARPRAPEKDKRKHDTQPHPPRRKSDSGLYLPVWSLGVMLLFVVGISFAIILLVLTLGGGTLPGGDPKVIIITSFPSATAPIPQFAPTLAAATLPGVGNPEVPQFPLEGPTLPPVVISPTPELIQIGSQVRTAGESVRVRPAPGLDNTELFFAQPGEIFTVVAGPEQASGLTWWQVSDPSGERPDGWIASNLIEVVPSQ
jgi:hypothetical protein